MHKQCGCIEHGVTDRSSAVQCTSSPGVNNVVHSMFYSRLYTLCILSLLSTVQSEHHVILLLLIEQYQYALLKGVVYVNVSNRPIYCITV